MLEAEARERLLRREEVEAIEAISNARTLQVANDLQATAEATLTGERARSEATAKVAAGKFADLEKVVVRYFFLRKI